MSVWAPELWPRRSPYDRQRVHDEAIRAARGVDPAIIAEQLSVTETFVRRRQRKLGPAQMQKSQIGAARMSAEERTIAVARHYAEVVAACRKRVGGAG